jgi:hypothetical protein
MDTGYKMSPLSLVAVIPLVGMVVNQLPVVTASGVELNGTGQTIPPQATPFPKGGAEASRVMAQKI